LERPQKKEAPKNDPFLNIQPNKAKKIEAKKTVTFDQFFNFEAPKNQVVNAPPKNNKSIQLIELENKVKEEKK
jgi:hypothetical protein